MKKIIFFSPVEFRALKQRHQGLAIEFAKNNYEVFFVNPIKSNGFSFHSESYKAINNLKIIDLKIPFKSVSHPIIQNFAVKIAFKLLKKKLHFCLGKCILWLAEPSCASIANYDWARIIYDCCDLHGAFPNQNKKVWQYYESIITEKVDLITVSHPYIKKHFDVALNKKSVLMPNATFFDTEKNQEIVSDNRKIKLLSSGAHYEWVDVDWLEMLTSMKDVELHIAGIGRGKSFAKLISKENVIFHGELPSNQLLQLMKSCQVGLIPFKDIELIKGVDPIKAYDYAAAGLEIWAPEIESLHSNKYITSFIANSESADEALKNIKSDACKKIMVQPVPTWHDRVQEILCRI